MGRLAEAMERAEHERVGNDPQGPRVRIEPRKWSSWYGTAKQEAMREPIIVAESASVAKPVAGMSEEIVCYYKRSSLRSEQYRSLRTRLLSANPRREHRIYAISSAVPKEGKSVTTVNLSFCLAEIPHLKVLIVDCDFRQSKLGQLLNIKSKVGLADLLCGRASFEEIIHPTPVPGLFYVPVGRTMGRSATELLSRDSARSAFERFRRDFNYTVVDTPPASTVADVGIIGQMTFGIIFVVRMNRTPEPVAQRALKHIANNNVPIIGGLLVGDDETTGGYGRKYGYYAYGGEENE